MSNKVQRILWDIAGAERKVLEDCPTDHKKFAAVGATILMTAVIAFFAGTSAAWYFTQSGDETNGNIIGSIIFGLLWATLIFTIDRSLVITLKKDPTLKRQKWVVPFFSRAALAVLIAFMVSIPLELFVFKSFIGEKQQDYNLSEIGNYTYKSKSKTGENELEIEVGRATKDIERLGENETDAKKKVSSYENQIEQWKNKKVNPSNSGEYVQARDDYYRKKRLYYNALEEYHNGQRLYEPSKDDLNIASNRMSQARKAWENSCQEKIDVLEKQLEKAEIELGKVQNQLGQSRSAYETARSRRDTLASMRMNNEKAKQVEINKGNHFIRNFEILDWAVLPSNNDGKWMDFIFLWMIRLLFFIIEILPTVVKIVTPVGAYDWRIHSEEENLKEYLNSDEYSQYLNKVHENELNAKEKQLEQQHDAELELKNQILEKMREAQTIVAEAAIEKWKNEQLEKLSKTKEDLTDDATAKII